MVVPCIVGLISATCIQSPAQEYWHKYDLADPGYAHSSQVDVLLSADVYADINHPDAPTVKNWEPSLLHTIFGSIVFGKISMETPHPNN